ncbi:hypothetical protein ACP275_01G100500 [Erythranthe tilingii]
MCPPLMSIVASAFSGISSSFGSGILTKLMEEAKIGGNLGRRSMFLGVEMKEILWPFRAMSLESSRYGIMCPKASHGNITMCRLRFCSLAAAIDGFGGKA